MSITKIGMFAGAVVSSFLALTPASAVILVEPIITTRNPAYPDAPGGFGLQPPGQLVVWNAPDTTGFQNFWNDTGLNINIISLLLLPELDQLAEEVAWGDVNGDGQIGFSNIFTTIEIIPDFTLGGASAPLLNLTGGEIINGERFVFRFITNPDLTPTEPGDNGPVLIAGAYNGVAATVPEPSNLSTLVGVGLIFSFGSLWKKYH